MSREVHIHEWLRGRIAWCFSCDHQDNGFDNSNIASVFGSRCLLPPWAFSQTPFVRAVNALSPNDKTLMLFIAGHYVSPDHLKNLLVAHWFDFLNSYMAIKRLNSTSFPRTQRLLEYALMNYKLQLTGQAEIKRKELMGIVECRDVKTYKRDWLPRLRVMRAVIAQAEHRALDQILVNLEGEDKAHA